MIQRYFLNKKPTTFKLTIKTNDYQDIIIAGFDTYSENTKFFFREMPVKGTKEYIFNLPLAPNNIDIVIWEKTEGIISKSSKFKIVSLVKNDFKQKIFLVDYLTANFIKFSNDFCLKASNIRPAVYRDKNSMFKIELFAELDTPTPARIHKLTNVIQVNKKMFDKMTVPSRIMILYHEFAHNYLNEDINDEEAADSNGLILYKAGGFPKIEAVYAFSQIFSEHETHYDRLSKLINELDDNEGNTDLFNDIYAKGIIT